MSQQPVLREVLDSARYISQQASHVGIQKQTTDEVARKVTFRLARATLNRYSFFGGFY